MNNAVKLINSIQRIPSGLPVKKLSIHTGFGEHGSVFKGDATDFYQFRPYDPERDSVRQIAWQLSNVSANEEVYVREAIVSKEIPVLVLADLSSSIDVGVDHFKKRTLLLELIGMLGLTAVYDQNRFGLIGFSNEIIFDEKLRTGKNNVYYLLKKIVDFIESTKSRERRGTDFSRALDFIIKRYRRRMMVFLISDFIGFEEVLDSPILKTVAARHEVICLVLGDLEEFELNNKRGYLRQRNIEDGKIIKIPLRKLDQIRESIKKDRENLMAKLAEIDIDSLSLEYGDHFKEINSFFAVRGRSGR